MIDPEARVHHTSSKSDPGDAGHVRQLPPVQLEELARWLELVDGLVAKNAAGSRKAGARLFTDSTPNDPIALAAGRTGDGESEGA
jgi:hypothetical protein